MPPNIVSNSCGVCITVGTKTGPFDEGPITAAPIAPSAAGKNDASISLVNTPGLTQFVAINNSPVRLKTKSE